MFSTCGHYGKNDRRLVIWQTYTALHGLHHYYKSLLTVQCLLICFVLIPVRLKLKFWNSILLTFLHQGFLSTTFLILHLLSISLLSPSNKWNCNYFYFILYQYASIIICLESHVFLDSFESHKSTLPEVISA